MLRRLSSAVLFVVGLAASPVAAECPNPSPLGSAIWTAFSTFVELEYGLDGSTSDKRHIAFGHALGRLASAGRGDPVRTEAIDCVILALDQASHITYGGFTLDDSKWHEVWTAAMGMHDDIVAAEFGVTDQSPAELVFAALGVTAPTAPMPQPQQQQVQQQPAPVTGTDLAGPPNVTAIEIWDAADYPIPRPGVVHPCGDPDVPVVAEWLFYARIYGGGGTSFFEKRDFICYAGHAYKTYDGAFESYVCDDDWMNCARTEEPPRPITEIEMEGDRTTYRYNDGNAWGNRFDLMPAAAPSADPPGVPDCPRIADHAGETGESLTCLCGADDLRTGEVWGDTFYTSDSDLCRAALHAGVIGAEGGQITYTMRQGQPFYNAATRNGITSKAYGAYGESFAFGTPVDRMAACPRDAEGLDGGVTCECSAGATASGIVWGSDVYTSDSYLCPAARHAGVIGPEGGVVTVRMIEGRDGYTGSERNGVSTLDYPRRWERSFTFR